MPRATINVQNTKSRARQFSGWLLTIIVSFVVASALFVFKKSENTATEKQLTDTSHLQPVKPQKQARPASFRNYFPISTTPAASFAEATAYTRQLVFNLCRLDPLSGQLTPELAAKWKQNLQELVQQGAAVVPAIAEFLKKNMDVDFGA